MPPQKKEKYTKILRITISQHEEGHSRYQDEKMKFT